MPTTVGIDSGLTGAVCILNGAVVQFFDAPTVWEKKGKGKRHKYLPTEMANILRPLSGRDDVMVVLEAVHAMPKNGGIGNFNSGLGLGLWMMACAALNLSCEMVDPRTWKSAVFGKVTGGDKSLSLRRACTLYPSASGNLARVKDHNRAEALLLCHWFLNHRGLRVDRNLEGEKDESGW